MKYFGFLTSVIKHFESYLSNKNIFVCTYIFSEAGTLKYGVPQGSFLGPLLSLLYVNDFPQTLPEAGSYLYADDTCIFYRHEDVKISALCQWFIDNKLLIRFGENKTKTALFSKARGLREINMSFESHSIKQHETVEYLRCHLEKLIRPHLYYGDILYDQTFNISFDDRLEYVQYSACLVITGVIRATSIVSRIRFRIS